MHGAPGHEYPIQKKHCTKMFIKRLKTVGNTGISLHSYRDAHAKRTEMVGRPERFAQRALGHRSRAFARVYSKKASVIVPLWGDYEEKTPRRRWR
jgi:integrase